VTGSTDIYSAAYRQADCFSTSRKESPVSHWKKKIFNYCSKRGILCHIMQFLTARTAVVFSAGVLFFAVATPSPAQPAPPAPPTLAPRRPIALPTNFAVPQPTPVPATPQNVPLTFDAEVKEYQAKPGETNASFVFNLTNNSPHEVIISSVTTSCGCTVAQLPSQPWHLAPGKFGQITASMNLAGKVGAVTKILTVNTSHGIKTLSVKSIIPEPKPGMDRGRNMQAALIDRQAVFKNECAKCHVEPTQGKFGKELYVTACGICHEAQHRAAMVPDLHALRYPTNIEYWKHWITNGKGGTLMPAFTMDQGGPLTREQIDSLAEYLLSAIPYVPKTPGQPVVPPAPKILPAPPSTPVSLPK
jgi:hypothetical protein